MIVYRQTRIRCAINGVNWRILMNRPKLYLSGPMTGVKDLNKSAFEEAAKKLRKKGYKVINPHDLDKKEPKRSWEDCLRRDIRYEMGCSAIANLPRWRQSRGALLENYIGKALKYPSHPVHYWLKRRK
jgi:hypothetical protein